jgi:hypothetical protein
VRETAPDAENDLLTTGGRPRRHDVPGLAAAAARGDHGGAIDRCRFHTHGHRPTEPHGIAVGADPVLERRFDASGETCGIGC